MDSSFQTLLMQEYTAGFQKDFTQPELQVSSVALQQYPCSEAKVL